jgi:hypothetical protein
MPSASAVVRDQGTEHREQRGRVDGVLLVDLDPECGHGVLARVDDAVRVGTVGS